MVGVGNYLGEGPIVLFLGQERMPLSPSLRVERQMPWGRHLLCLCVIHLFPFSWEYPTSVNFSLGNYPFLLSIHMVRVEFTQHLIPGVGDVTWTIRVRLAQ